MDFKANARFKKDYDELFREDPEQANMLLLLCELADKNGQVYVEDDIDQLTGLFNARFNSPEEYSL